jgi:hypothetical protein
MICSVWVRPSSREMAAPQSPPLRAVAPVAEALHQLGERGGDPARFPAGLPCRAGEAEPGDARHDEVECVGRIAAVGARVGERPRDLGEFHDRARPAVRDDQRSRVRFRRSDVREVDVRAVNRGRELRPFVQSGFSGTPVILVPPVPCELLQVVERNAVGPARSGHFVGPAGAVEALVEIVQVVFRKVDAERVDALVGRSRHDRRRLCLPGRESRRRSSIWTRLAMPGFSACQPRARDVRRRPDGEHD